MSATEMEESWNRVIKEFSLPAKIPFEDLMLKYSGVLDIRLPKFDETLEKTLLEVFSGEAIGDGNHLENRSIKNNAKTTPPLKKVTRNNSSKKGTLSTDIHNKNNHRNKPNSPEEDEDDQSDCVIISSNISQFKHPSKTQNKTTRRSAGERQPPAKKATTASTVSNATNNTTSRNAKRKRDQTDDRVVKPGTVGSRQTVTAVPSLPKIISTECEDLIDTKNMVNSNMMISLQELCQLAKIKDVPDDPTDLLMKFSLVIPRLSEIDVYVENDGIPATPI